MRAVLAREVKKGRPTALINSLRRVSESIRCKGKKSALIEDLHDRAFKLTGGISSNTGGESQRRFTQASGIGLLTFRKNNDQGQVVARSRGAKASVDHLSELGED